MFWRGWATRILDLKGLRWYVGVPFGLQSPAKLLSPTLTIPYLNQHLKEGCYEDHRSFMRDTSRSWRKDFQICRPHQVRTAISTAADFRLRLLGSLHKSWVPLRPRGDLGMTGRSTMIPARNSFRHRSFTQSLNPPQPHMACGNGGAVHLPSVRRQDHLR